MKEKAIHHPTFWEKTAETVVLAFAWIKQSKVAIWLFTGIAWLSSTYVNLQSALLFFFIATFFQIWSKIDVQARQSKIPFRPWTKKFWFVIDLDILRDWLRLVFKEYFIYILLGFAFDVIILKSNFHFNVASVKLDIPTAFILFFSGIELFTGFRHREEIQSKNYLKVIFSIFSGFLPESIKTALDKTFKQTNKKPKAKINQN